MIIFDTRYGPTPSFGITIGATIHFVIYGRIILATRSFGIVITTVVISTSMST